MSGPSNYPPGVTGREPQIIGYPECGSCGHEAEAHDDDGVCTECECAEYDPYGEDPREPDYDPFDDPASYAR